MYINVNTNLTADLDLPLNIGSDGLQIDIDDAEESATGYHVKMRTHYGTFCQCQLVTHGHNDVSLYSFVTSFRVDKPLPALKMAKLDPWFIFHCLLLMTKQAKLLTECLLNIATFDSLLYNAAMLYTFRHGSR